MNTNILYDIYTINRETEGEDLAVSLAKYKAAHPGAVSHEDDKAIREFIGTHGPELARAFDQGKEAFEAAVAACEAEGK